ncbi:hypothetical protein TI39_contig4154g00025 [Zymoseptoria brevis]|uniref:MYND-type domain-containing protein n=1 Tax=Zymoseptoria brevis TaxID=1047168 RepID=A0A0F4GBY4_9PEZI|nr:hypothetical protein TI39_contig4154g00025 [Zymoseptoria brevis]
MSSAGFATATPSNTSSSPKCSQCDKPASSLKRCAKCKSTSYCNRACQTAHWKVHKKSCAKLAGNGGDEGPSTGAEVPERSDSKPFTAIYHNNFLHDRSEEETFKILIDTLRMRQEDMYFFHGDTMPGTIYDGSSTSIPAFRQFIRKAQAVEGFLPPWWTDAKLEQCIRFSKDEGGFSLAGAQEKSDIQETWKDTQMPMKVLANMLHNCGLCDLKGVMINTNSKHGALATSVINTYYGNGDVPIAAIRPITNETFADSWAFTLTIISIGFLTNLAALLSSTSGLDLVTSKVAKLVVMGGRYQPGRKQGDPYEPGWEFNFGGQDSNATATILRSWPRSVPITFSGGELGETIFSGQDLRTTTPFESPVRAAYEWYVGRCSTTRESWDPLTVLYGVLGLEGFAKLGVRSPFKYGNQWGYNSIVSANGSNAWGR